VNIDVDNSLLRVENKYIELFDTTKSTKEPTTMHKFTTSTAEERKAHRVEVEDILMSMLDTEVTLSSSAMTHLSGRGITFTITGTVSMHRGRYSVQTSKLDTVSFGIGDVETAWVAASGNVIRLDTNN
jgi:hypothetical protein